MDKINIMIKQDLKGRGIVDKNILDAFGKIHREKFVPIESKDQAYDDYPLSIGKGQTISQPYIIALMLQSLEINKMHKILEIGTGSGYATALMSTLCKEVISVERIPSLLESAKVRLKNFKNIKLIQSNGYNGISDEAPFDRILVSAAPKVIPDRLISQLAPDGIMVLPLGSRHFQILTKVEKKNKEIIKTPLTECIFVPLIEELP